MPPATSRRHRSRSIQSRPGPIRRLYRAATHAGDDVRVDRVARPNERVLDPAVTLGVFVQPYGLAGLAGRLAFRERGLLGRFLYALPESRLGYREVNTPPVPPLLRKQFQQQVRRLLEMPFQQGKDGHDVPRPLRLSAAAETQRLAFAAWIEPQLREDGELGMMPGWGSKLAGAVLRIAGLLHLADRAEEDKPWEDAIDGETMARAVQLAHYLIPHARVVFTQMGVDPLVQDAQYLLRWVARKGSRSFSKREAFEGTKGRFKEVAALDAALDLLVAHNYLRLHPLLAARPRKGRPPSPVYQVNKLIVSAGMPALYQTAV